MKHETFLRGVIVAFILAAASAIAFLALQPVFGAALVLRGVIAVSAGAYVLYLLRRSDERAGRLAVPALWLPVAIVIHAMAPDLVAFALAHVGTIWLVRSLYFHAGITAALLDLGVCGTGFVAALAAAGSSHSLFLTVWSFFLVQALFVAIPSVLRAESPAPTTNADERFQRARATAEAAVRRVYSTR